MSAELNKEYLRSVIERYAIAKTTLPRLPDDEFGRIKSEANRKGPDVESFLMDFAIGAETERRNIERWATGRSIKPASAEHIRAITAALPSYSIANAEAMGAMNIEEVKHYKIDIVVEDIIGEIAKRMPRKIDAYRFKHSYANETLTIPGLGEIQVSLHESGDGIFRNIGTVESDMFRIWNCRDSGVGYMGRLKDISKPSEIKAKPLGLKVSLYEKDGVYVVKNRKEFTNVRWKTAAGKGYDTDDLREDLHRTYSGPNDMASDYIDINKGWREDKTVLSWEQTEDEMIVWLNENVLNPLKDAPKPEKQVDKLPEEEPFPEGKIGPLYTFAKETDLKRISLIKNKPTNAYPDERYGIRPHSRISFSGRTIADVPDAANDVFTWCGVGEINKNSDIEKITNIGHMYRRSESLMSSEGVAAIKPKTSTDIYVVDWQKYEDYRRKTFTPKHDKLTDEEVEEMIQSVAKTLVPIAEYKGDYEQPIVLVSRDLELDEVEAVYFVSEENNR